jgi:formylmethanofuran dehydrogenase subunit E
MKKLLFTLFCVLLAGTAMAQSKFCIASQGKTATIVVDNDDWKGVVRAARNLADHVRKVTGTAAPKEN